jgi:hypothetical protein
VYCVLYLIGFRKHKQFGQLDGQGLQVGIRSVWPEAAAAEGTIGGKGRAMRIQIINQKCLILGPAELDPALFAGRQLCRLMPPLCVNQSHDNHELSLIQTAWSRPALQRITFLT